MKRLPLQTLVPLLVLGVVSGCSSQEALPLISEPGQTSTATSSGRRGTASEEEKFAAAYNDLVTVVQNPNNPNMSYQVPDSH